MVVSSKWKFEIFYPDFLCHIFNENQTIICSPPSWSRWGRKYQKNLFWGLEIPLQPFLASSDVNIERYAIAHSSNDKVLMEELKYRYYRNNFIFLRWEWVTKIGDDILPKRPGLEPGLPEIFHSFITLTSKSTLIG